MPTPQEQLDAMLTDFENRTKTATTNPGKNFRDLLNGTPEMKTRFLEAIDKGNLVRLEPETDPGAFGSYNSYDRTMRLPIAQLNTADRNVQDANSVRFTIGHEIEHGVTRDGKLQLDKNLKDQVQAIAQGPSPHDYTATIKAFNDGARGRESRAEIAGFNTLSAHVRRGNPAATLKDVYDASPSDMRMYIDADLSKRPPTYTPKAGLHIGADLKMDEGRSLEAMGRYFYDANGYPGRQIGGAIGEIQRQEAAQQAAHPGRPAPQIKINLSELGFAGARLPPGMTDSSPRLRPEQDAAQPSAANPTGAADPRDRSHPDNAYFQLLRDKLPASVPDNAVAQAMLSAKQGGLIDPSKVNADQVGVVDGKVWINGTTPGFGVGIDPAKAPSMEQVAQGLQSLRQGQESTPAPAQGLEQDKPQPAAVGR